MKATITYLSVATICAAALLLGSCKKSESNTTAKANLLTSGKWTLQKFEYLKKDGTWDFFQPSLTISYEFREDKTAVSIVGSNSSVRGWTLSGDLTQLTIARASGGADTYNIVQLTASTLQLSPVGYNSTTYQDERDTYTH